MTNKIGFGAKNVSEQSYKEEVIGKVQTVAPKKSLVQVLFPDRHLTLTYYNDSFDLKAGDLVYVEGKLERRIGRVLEVNYTFKIKLSDYKRVIAVVDTDIKGQFFMAGAHFVTFFPEALPKERARMWFLPPCEEEEEYVVGNEDEPIILKDMSGMKISGAIADKGHQYYMDNCVSYICIDGTKGYAIVEGSKPYEVEFTYHNGEVTGLVCSCYCGGRCKHGFAALLQLRETLDIIMENYEEEYERYDYFAAILKSTMFCFAIDGKTKGSIIL